MKIEVELSPVIGVNGIVELAREIDSPYVSRLGISDVAMLFDSYLIQALCTQATEHVAVGSLVTNPYTRHESVIASAVNTLAEISGGRAFLGIGVGAGLGALGIKQIGTAKHLDTTLDRVVRLLRGDSIEFKSSSTEVRSVELKPKPSFEIPVVIGTRSRLVCEVAGRWADAVVVGTRDLSYEGLSRYRQWIGKGLRTSGRDMSDIEISPRVTICASEDAERARRSVVLYAAHYLALSEGYQQLLDDNQFARLKELVSQTQGWYFESDVVYPKELENIVTDEIIDQYAIAGTPDYCVDRIRELRDKGFDGVSMNIAAVRRDHRSLQDGLVECIHHLRSMFSEVYHM